MFEQILIANELYLYALIPILLLAYIFVWRSSRLSIGRKLLLSLTYLLLIGSFGLLLADVSIETEVPQRELANLAILVDNSSSMNEHEIDYTQIYDNINIKTTTVSVAQATESPLNAKIANTLYQNGQFLLITDGFATDGDDLTKIAQTAISLNATIHALDLDAFKNDASVVLYGPQKTFIGTTNTYVARVNGNNVLPGSLVVYLDNEEVYRSTDLSVDHSIPLTFNSQEVKQLHAKLELSDDVMQNNDYYLTTRIIEKPKVVYIGADKPIESFTKQIFDVTSAQTVPDNLDPYSAIIMGNAQLTNIEAEPIEEFVSNGGGLALFGGTDAFDLGKYDAHDLATLLPVEKGKSGNRQKATVVIALDISASTEALFSQVSNNKAIEIQKAIAYTIVEQLGDDNVVGVIAFNTEPYVVSELVPLSISRKTVLDKITRIQMQGSTRINKGLGAAHELLKNEVGTSAVILISDGLAGGDSDGPKSRSVAKKFSQEGIKLFTVGVGSHIDDGFLRQLALDTDGVFLRPEETDRLAIQFGKVTDDLNRNPSYSFIIDDFSHPITFGLEHPSTQLNNVNQVVPKAGADVLVKTNRGDPALTIWNYGLGRVGAWSAFEGISNQKELLGSDSYLFGRLLTWSAGDPEIKNPPLFVIEDTTLLKQARVKANANSLAVLAEQLGAEVNDLTKFNFEKTDENTFEGDYLSRSIGFTTFYNSVFATNYAPELRHIGQSTAVEKLAKATGGSFITIDQLNEIESKTIENSKQIKAIKPLSRELAIAALIFLILHIIVGKQKGGKKRTRTK